jgi:integrase
MHAKLTEIGVKRLQAPEKGRLEVWDKCLPGFGVRVTTSGQKTFMAMYRSHGVQRRQTFGSYPAVTLADARKLARKAFAQVAEGRDPSTEKRERREGGKADSFRAVQVEYLERYAKRHKRERSWREDERLIGRELLPKWGTRRIGGLSKADVLKLLDATADRAPIMANRLLALIRKFFNWSQERGYIETNPCAGIKAPSKERTRERVLTDDELRKLWPAFEAMQYPFGALFKVLLITGQRVSEVAGMRRDELALDPVPLWTLSSERTKAARQHVVPLPSLAVDLLRSLPELGSYVFTTHGNKPVSGLSKAKARADALSGVTGWRLHDLRRSTATGLARLGTAPHVVSEILNHAPAGITRRIYNRHSYQKEMGEALELWVAHLQGIIGGGAEVVPIFGARDR